MGLSDADSRPEISIRFASVARRFVGVSLTTEIIAALAREPIRSAAFLAESVAAAVAAGARPPLKTAAAAVLLRGLVGATLEAVTCAVGAAECGGQRQRRRQQQAGQEQTHREAARLQRSPTEPSVGEQSRRPVKYPLL